MFKGNNLKSFLYGSTKSRELSEMRESWESTQELWHASPLVHTPTNRMAVDLVKQMIVDGERTPAFPVLIATSEAIETLYRGEEIGPIEANWDILANDVEAAFEFRQMLVRRRRWAGDFHAMQSAFQRIVRTSMATFWASLPESCYSAEYDGDHGDTFEVPLIDLLDDPAATIEQLLMLPYDDESFRLGLFWHLRGLCAGNLLVASGFQRDDDINGRSPKLVLPSKQKDKTGAELAEAYLAGSPLKALLDALVPFRIPDELRFEHCHIVGGTGHGKTQLMQKMIHADLVASQEDGRSVMVIDSQGDLINKLVRLEFFSPDTPDSLADRLVLIDPSDVEFPAALNLFDAHLDRVRDYSPADRERVLNGVFELYELFFGAFLGAELTQKQGVIFKYLARLMLAIPDATIHTLMRIMEDGRPFKPYMDQLDGSARYFFETEFFHPSFAATKKQVLRRLWGVLSTPAFERMFTQPKNKLDLFEAMNEGKIILVSTAKDLLKREGSQLLGRFFIAMVTQAALERSTLSERLRRPAFVYVDEAQEYFDDSIETILNQARKYRVGLTLAHQTLDQLSPRLRSALLSNTSMKCAGGVSAKDARALADELRTTPAFIEGMKRRGPRSEFAVWVKNLTGQAIRLSVPLGFLERQATLDEEDFDSLIENNRRQFCGTLAATPALRPSPVEPPADSSPQSEPPTVPATSPAFDTPLPRDAAFETVASPPAAPRYATERDQVSPVMHSPPSTSSRRAPAPAAAQEQGKGGPKHRYMQALIKQLAEEQGFRATIEAPLPNKAGQIDVLLERDDSVIPVEVSVTTPVEQECENVRKCLEAGHKRMALVLVKSKTSQANYKSRILESVSEADREKIVFLSPDDIADFIGALVPPPTTEKVVKGYKVRVSHDTLSPDETKARREALARVIARSLEKAK